MNLLFRKQMDDMYTMNSASTMPIIYRCQRCNHPTTQPQVRHDLMLCEYCIRLEDQGRYQETGGW